MRNETPVFLLALFMSGCGFLDGGPEPEPASGTEDVVEVMPVPRDGEEPDGEEGDGLRASDCDEVEPGEPVAEGGCVTAKIECGDTIVGHTKGGVDRFDTKFYEHHQCTPATTNHDSGDERVYELLVPEGDKTVDVYLTTPCANLSLAAIKHGGDDCPTFDTPQRRCEMWPKPGNKKEHVHLVSKKGARWLLVVEGQDEDEGAFELKVECQDGLK